MIIFNRNQSSICPHVAKARFCWIDYHKYGVQDNPCSYPVHLDRVLITCGLVFFECFVQARNDVKQIA